MSAPDLTPAERAEVERVEAAPAAPESHGLVQPGQVWADADPRSAGRTLLIEEIQRSALSRSNDRVVCTVLTVARNVSEKQVGKTTRIRLDRFTGGHYRLVDVAS